MCSRNSAYHNGMKFAPCDGNAAADLFVGIIRYNRCMLYGTDYMIIRTAKEG